ncbi:hypothetical protein BJY00DRAFT_311260 [Aspergillus carlsbadensis]|nr:hypothetical protein BJY00DRAFT_311260 [Aspergillus carlsbadensis]
MTPAPAPPPEYNSDSPPPYTPPTRPNTPNDINSPNYPVDSVFIHPVESPHENRPYAAILTGLRTLQYLLAVTTIAIYAPENNHTSSTQAPAKCIYVGLVAWLSGVTCLLHYLFQVKRSEWFIGNEDEAWSLGFTGLFNGMGWVSGDWDSTICCQTKV